MLSNRTSELNKTRNLRNGHEFLTREGKGENNVTQVTIKAENRLNFKEGHYIESGIGFESNNVQILRDLNNKKLIDQDTRLNRMFLYIQDYWPVNKNIEIKTGLRTNYAFYLNKFSAFLKARFRKIVKTGKIIFFIIFLNTMII